MPTPDLALLRSLALAAGPPGAEGEVRGIVRAALDGIGEIRHDRLGSLLCELRGRAAAPRVVLDAHLDEVGFAVQSIAADGRIKFIPLGGWWGHVLLAQRVDILTEGGRKVPGVVASKPPHFLTEAERKNVLTPELMAIDVGAASRDAVERLGIRVGDPIAPHAEWLELAGGIVSCKAFDDRVGVAVLVESMRSLAQSRPAGTVIGVAAVQEEIGCRGAATASALSRPDVAIVLEGTPADDAPRTPESQAVLGEGPQLRFSDPSAISNRALLRHVERAAAAQGIPVQVAVRTSGGTDAKSIHVHGAGVPTVVIGVPARYIHTHVTLIDPRDYSRAIELTVAVATALDAATVEAFTAF
jgi:endoglucanase